jgi:hypothetical protein
MPIIYQDDDIDPRTWPECDGDPDPRRDPRDDDSECLVCEVGYVIARALIYIVGGLVALRLLAELL